MTETTGAYPPDSERIFQAARDPTARTVSTAPEPESGQKGLPSRARYRASRVKHRVEPCEIVFFAPLYRRRYRGVFC